MDSLRELRGTDDPEVNIKRIIIEYLSSSTFPHAEEAATYENIVFTLTNHDAKRKNVYAGTCSLAVSKLLEK